MFDRTFVRIVEMEKRFSVKDDSSISSGKVLTIWTTSDMAI